MAAMKILATWWRSLPFLWRRWRIVSWVGAGDDVPESLPQRGVVLVGTSASPTWAVFDCPCRTGHRLMVNLDRTRYPFWTIELQRPLSIHPSIDNITRTRRCHFTIRNGRLRWAVPTNPE